MIEGQCIGLDAHLSDLLDIYTQARNRWVREKLRAGGLVDEEGRPKPDEVSSEEIGRELLRAALMERLDRCEGWI
jgi:hypothetical protein